MRRVPPRNPKATGAAKAPPGPEQAALALRKAEALMLPIATWLLRSGVLFPTFSNTVKRVFVNAAKRELMEAGALPTQSAVSLLSGVHRKEVREISATEDDLGPVPRPSVSSQVYTLWITSARYRGKDGKPRALSRLGPGRTFESLCREVSQDVHPRAVLDELMRLGQVALDEDKVVPLIDSFVPVRDAEALNALFAANAADHLAAAVSNLTTDAPRFLEQAVYADGLEQDSIEALHKLARQAWSDALEVVTAEARKRVQRDFEGTGNLRMRFGSYFFSEPVTGATSEGEPAKARKARKPRRSPESKK